MTEYPERFPRNNCAWNSHVMTLLHPELAMVEGYLVFAADGGEYRMEHVWNETPEGQVVDSTAWAFDGETLPYRYEPDPEAWARLGLSIKLEQRFLDQALAEAGGSGEDRK